MNTAAHQIAAAILRELSYPNSPWHRDFPSPARLAQLFGVHPATINRALAMLGAEHLLVQRSTRTPTGNVSRMMRWQPPLADAAYSATELALKLSHAILNGGLHILPDAEHLAALYRTNLDTIEETMRTLCNRGLVTSVHDPHTGAFTRWTVNTEDGYRPGTIASPTIASVIDELTRRILTGWYEYDALDGTRRSRPFPTPTQICAQFHCAPTAAHAALRRLARTGLITPPTPNKTTTSPGTPAPKHDQPHWFPIPEFLPDNTTCTQPHQYALTKLNAVLHHTDTHPRRYLHLDNLTRTVKIRSGNGYDHYAPTGTTENHHGQQLHVFVWSDRTYIAE